jgi:hypothetical protein
VKEIDLQVMLRDRFSPPEWVYIDQVANGTGGSHRRTADGVAWNCYPSRGCEVHGFEIKVRRNDWLRELNDPEKSVPVQRYCDRWWIVVASRDIVEKGELPPTWGLMAPSRGKLRVVTQAPSLKPENLTRIFVASLLRRSRRDDHQAVAIAESRGFERGRVFEREGKASATGYELTQLRKLRQSVDEFQKASGVAISPWDAGDIGRAVRAILRGNVLLQLRRQKITIDALATQLGDAIGELEKNEARNPGNGGQRDTLPNGDATTHVGRAGPEDGP